MEDQKTNKMTKLIVLAAAIFVVVAGMMTIAFFLFQQNSQVGPENVAPAPVPEVEGPKESNEQEEPGEIVCAMDAKECPNGSFVARDPENNCQFSPCPGEEGGENPIDIGGWQTYRNEEYGIGFMYPAQWRQVDSIVKRKIHLIEFTDLTIEEEKKWLFPFNPDRTIEEFYINNHFFWADVIDINIKEYKKSLENEFLSSKKNVTLNDREWFYYDYFNGYADLAKAILTTTIDCKKGKYVFVLGFSTPYQEEIIIYRTHLMKMAESLEASL